MRQSGTQNQILRCDQKIRYSKSRHRHCLLRMRGPCVPHQAIRCVEETAVSGDSTSSAHQMTWCYIHPSTAHGSGGSGAGLLAPMCRHVLSVPQVRPRRLLDMIHSVGHFR
jgi:hypothetical protein